MRSVLQSLPLILIFFRPALAAEASSPRPEVSVLAGASIAVAAGMPVLLSDIGGVSFVSNDIWQKAADLVVLESFGDGEQRTYSNVELVRILKEKIAADAGMAGLNWTYFVPETTRVRGVKNGLSQNRINQRILGALNEKCEKCSFQIRDLKIPLIQESRAMSRYDVETGPLKIAGGFLLPLRVSFAGGEKVYYVTGQVTAQKKSLVATRSIRIGEKIEAGDVKTEDTEIGFSSDAFAETQDLSGKTAARQIQMGRAIYKSDLKKEVVIQRGQSIRAILGNESFEVSAQMTAEESGAVGDVIKVKNPETQKSLSGEIVERGVVRIQ